MIIRHATNSDLKAINDIYNYFVKNAYSTFDINIWSMESRSDWFNKYSADSPYQIFVAEFDNAITGWACTSRYRDHIAFSRTAETTVYIHPNHHGKGVGSQLYSALFKSIARYNLHTILAGVALPNDASVQLHKKFGFEEIGVFKEYAMKNDKYVSSMWLQKRL